MRKLFSNSLLFTALLVKISFAQAQDSTTIPKKVVSQIFRIGVDLSRLFMSGTQKEFKGAEFSMDFSRGNWIGEFHFGGARNEQTVKNFVPVSSGYFGSLGISKNVFSDPHNVLSFGGRLAYSQYSYQPTQVDLSESGNGHNKQNLAKSNCSAVWFEVVTSMRAQIWSSFMMGFEFRIKPRIHSKIGNDLPHFLPGYGLYSNNTSLGFNYYLYYQIPLRNGP